VSASVNLPSHHKVQKFSSGTGSHGWSRKKGHGCGGVVVSVCLSLRELISGATHVIFTRFFVHVAYGHGSLLLWRGDKIPRGRGNFGVFLPTDNAM